MMSFMCNYPSGGTADDNYYASNMFDIKYMNRNMHKNNNIHLKNYNNLNDFSDPFRDYINNSSLVRPNDSPSSKRRKISASNWRDSGTHNLPSTHYNPVIPPARSSSSTSTSIGYKRDRSKLEDDEVVFMSKDEIERCSPSRKDGIDATNEAHLRYSYCSFLQDLGAQLELPQTTTGTAMVLCHRFFVRRSHASHDRFLIATAALFLAAKFEETPRPLNNVLRASCETFHMQDISLLSYLLPVDWFEQYRERVTEAEQMILTTLNFELTVQHPYAPLTSVLTKLGLAQTILVNLALYLVNEGLRSSLWLQVEPHHIAAGAVYLAAKFLNLDLASYRNIWKEFHTEPSILHDVAQQLMELF